jgi:hypothetical protein
VRLLGEVDERLGIIGSLNCRQKVSAGMLLKSYAGK